MRKINQTLVIFLTIFIGVIFFNFSSVSAQLPSNKTTTLCGKLYSGLTNRLIVYGYVFALSTSSEKILGCATSWRRPYEGRWIISGLPDRGEIVLVAFHPSLKDDMAIKRVKLNGAFNEEINLITSMDTNVQAPGKGGEHGSSPLYLLSLAGWIAHEINTKKMNDTAMALANRLLNLKLECDPHIHYKNEAGDVDTNIMMPVILKWGHSKSIKKHFNGSDINFIFTFDPHICGDGGWEFDVCIDGKKYRLYDSAHGPGRNEISPDKSYLKDGVLFKEHLFTGEKYPFSCNLQVVRWKGRGSGKTATVQVLFYDFPSVSSAPDVKEDKGNLKISLYNIKCQIYESNRHGKLLIIEGKISNRYNLPRSFIHLEVALFKNRKRIVSKKTFAGNKLNFNQIETMTIKEIHNITLNKYGQNNSNINIKPNQKVPFMIVFPINSKEMVDEYSVNVLSSNEYF